MSWAGLTLVTDTDIGAIEPEATTLNDQGIGSWGRVSWPEACAAAKRDVSLLLEMAFSDLPGVTDRVRDTWAADYAMGFTAGAYTDLRAKVSDITAADVSLASIFATPASDRLYLGADWAFDALALQLSTRNAAASALTVQYSGAAGWTTLTSVDGTATAGATLAKSGRITWRIPADWERVSVNGSDPAYFIAVSVSVAVTAVASQVLPVRAPAGLRKVAAYFAVSHVMRSLAAQATKPEEWRKQADYYHDLAEKTFEALRVRGAIPVDIGNDNVVTAEEQQQGASIARVSIGRS